MNRFHVHVAVSDLDQSIGFYSTLFGTEPTELKDDYAKWMLDDPAINFAISTRAGATPGIEHIGLEVGSRAGLDEIAARLKHAEQVTFDQEATNCCYAISDKTWVNDPSRIRWETFFTHGKATTYGEDALPVEEPAGRATAQSPAARCCSNE
jgi:catechol 2,3-dioxygenase-like lactoylglutathione lyase family enzyme